MVVPSIQAVAPATSDAISYNQTISPNSSAGWQLALADQKQQQTETLSVDGGRVKLNIPPQVNVEAVELLVERHGKDNNRINVLLRPEQSQKPHFQLVDTVLMSDAGLAALKDRIEQSGVVELSDGQESHAVIEDVSIPSTDTGAVSKDSAFYQKAVNAINASKLAITSHANDHNLNPKIDFGSVNYGIEHNPTLAGKYEKELSLIKLYQTADPNLRIDLTSVAVHEYGHHLFNKNGLHDAISRVLPGYDQKSDLIGEGVAELYVKDVMPKGKADLSPAYEGYRGFIEHRVVPSLPGGMQTLRQALLEGDSSAQQAFANTVKAELEVYDKAISKEFSLMQSQVSANQEIVVDEIGYGMYQLPKGEVLFDDLFALVLGTSAGERHGQVKLTVNADKVDENLLAKNLVSMQRDSQSAALSNSTDYQITYKLASGYSFIVNHDSIKLKKDNALLGELNLGDGAASSKFVMQHFIDNVSSQWPGLLNAK